MTDLASHTRTLHAWKSIDWIGAALFVTSLSAFLAPVSWGGIMFSWYVIPIDRDTAHVVVSDSTLGNPGKHFYHSSSD
jgi:hypothetical protein